MGKVRKNLHSPRYLKFNLHKGTWSALTSLFRDATLESVVRGAQLGLRRPQWHSQKFQICRL